MVANGPGPFATYSVVMTSTRLKNQIRWGGEWTDVEIDEQILILPHVDIPQRLLDYPDTLLESIEVAGGQGLGITKDFYCPIDKASL